MSKLNLSNITSGYQTTVTQNANNAAIVTAIENTLSRDGTSPNTMNSTLDMNGFLIINQGNPVVPSGLTWMGPWVTTRSYPIGGIVENLGIAYICIIAHISGTFATDLLALKWQLFISGTLPSQVGNSGKYLTTNGTIANWHTAVETTSNIGSAQLPVGTTAQRDGGQGAIRFNSSYGKPEIHNGTNYIGLGGATGAGGDSVFYENDSVVTTAYTISNNKNAVATGPITFNAAVIVNTGSRLVIV